MDCPLVTVLTPSYNSGPTILETVASVLSQDYPNIEYIIIDDGSNRFEPDLILEFAHEKNPSINIKIIQNDINMGTPHSLNRGISESSGKYIFNIASDDRFHDKHVISDWTREFETTGALVITGLRDVFDHKMKVRFRTDPPKKVRKTIIEDSPSELFRKMYGTNMIIGCSTAFSRKCVEHYGKFNENYHIIEDYPQYLKLSREGVKIHFFNRIVVDYRSGGISSQQRFNERYESESDSILKNEVLPFTEEKEKAIEAYQAWKKRAMDKQEFLRKYTASSNIFSKTLCLFRYGLKDRGMALLFMQERLILALHRD